MSKTVYGKSSRKLKSYREPCQVKDGRRIYGEVRLYGYYFKVISKSAEGKFQFKYLCPFCLR